MSKLLLWWFIQSLNWDVPIQKLHVKKKPLTEVKFSWISEHNEQCEITNILHLSQREKAEMQKNQSKWYKLDVWALTQDGSDTNITPLNKKAERTLKYNFRPVPIISQECKLLEGFILNELWKPWTSVLITRNELWSYNVITCDQHGFQEVFIVKQLLKAFLTG